MVGNEVTVEFLDRLISLDSISLVQPRMVSVFVRQQNNSSAAVDGH